MREARRGGRWKRPGCLVQRSLSPQLHSAAHSFHWYSPWTGRLRVTFKRNCFLTWGWRLKHSRSYALTHTQFKTLLFLTPLGERALCRTPVVTSLITWRLPPVHPLYLEFLSSKCLETNSYQLQKVSVCLLRRGRTRAEKGRTLALPSYLQSPWRRVSLTQDWGWKVRARLPFQGNPSQAFPAPSLTSQLTCLLLQEATSWILHSLALPRMQKCPLLPSPTASRGSLWRLCPSGVVPSILGNAEARILLQTID